MQKLSHFDLQANKLFSCRTAADINQQCINLQFTSLSFAFAISKHTLIIQTKYTKFFAIYLGQNKKMKKYDDKTSGIFRHFLSLNLGCLSVWSKSRKLHSIPIASMVRGGMLLPLNFQDKDRQVPIARRPKLLWFPDRDRLDAVWRRLWPISNWWSSEHQTGSLLRSS